MKPTAVHEEDRANGPVLNRLDISSASVKPYLWLYKSMKSHRTEEAQTKRVFLLKSDSAVTDVTPTKQLSVEHPPLDFNHLPRRK